MKTKIIIALFQLFGMTTVHGQKALTFDYKPYFAAVIVSNVESSAHWYQDVFGLKVNKVMKDANAGYNIVLLESPILSLELLELKGSLKQVTILEGKPQETKIQGLFKIGFKVSNIDECLKQLSILKIRVDKVWTDADTRKRNFIINDPDGNLIQFFE